MCIYYTPLGCRFLTGNPCTKYEGYREYVVVAVPQLQSLDGTDITRTERLQASQVHCRAHCMPAPWCASHIAATEDKFEMDAC